MKDLFQKQYYVSFFIFILDIIWVKNELFYNVIFGIKDLSWEIIKIYLIRKRIVWKGFVYKYNVREVNERYHPGIYDMLSSNYL